MIKSHMGVFPKNPTHGTAEKSECNDFRTLRDVQNFLKNIKLVLKVKFNHLLSYAI